MVSKEIRYSDGATGLAGALMPEDGQFAKRPGVLVALELARTGIELGAIASVHGTLSTTRSVEACVIRTPVLVCHGASIPAVR